MLLFCGWKQRNIRRLGMSGKMSARQFKISTLSKLNLAKIGLNNYKAKYEKLLKEISQKVKVEVYLQILDAMVGPELTGEWREKKLEDLKKGHYNDQLITLLPGYKPNLQIEEPLPPQKAITKTVKDMANFLYGVYYQRIKAQYSSVDINKEAMKNVEEEGIIFLDEIDKLAVPEGNFMAGKGVSTEGVQRDLLPLIEGTTINTKFGDIKTDHILFIASGSFSMAKVEDLLPELLGRLPIRVDLQPITRLELERILKEPQFNLLLQQQKLMETEKIKLIFSEEAISEMAEHAYLMNLNTENLGARRLHAIVEKVMEDFSFNSPIYTNKQIHVTREIVQEKLKKLTKTIDLQKFLI